MYDYYRLSRDGSRTFGRIIGRDRDNHNSTRVEYVTAGGEQRTCTDSGVGPMERVGDEVLVTYIESSRESCIVGDAKRRLANDAIFNAMVVCGIGVTILLSQIRRKQASHAA